MEAVKHPFLVNLHSAFQTNNKLYLLLEYLSGGELFTLLERGVLLEEAASLSVRSLWPEHLHDNGITWNLFSGQLPSNGQSAMYQLLSPLKLSFKNLRHLYSE